MISEYFNSIIDLYLANPMAQTSGFMWMVCVWIAFLHKDDLKTISMLFIASLFWWMMFLLLKSYAGLAAMMIAMLRLYLSMKYKKNMKMFLFLLIIMMITWAMTYESYYSLLPMLWSFMWAYSFFFFSGMLLSMWCLGMSMTWLMYNTYIWSMWWMMNEIVVEILMMITMYNYVWMNWYKLHFMSKMKSIFHPYHDIDYWHYTMVKDKNKILTKHTLGEKLSNIFIHKSK